MALNLGIKSKTILPLLTILVIAMSGLAVYNYHSQVALLDKESGDSLRNTLNSTQSFINQQTLRYQQMATIIAEMPLLADTFAKGDRNRLISELQSGFKILASDA